MINKFKLKMYISRLIDMHLTISGITQLHKAQTVITNWQWYYVWLRNSLLLH